MSYYARIYAKAEKAEASIQREPVLAAVRKAFLEAGKPSMSIRNRIVLPRDDLDDRLQAALRAWVEASTEARARNLAELP